MSRKYREYKSILIEAYGREGKFPSYKITLSKYKKIKREVQRHNKEWNKFLKSQRKGAILVTSIDSEEYRIYENEQFIRTI